MHKHSVHCSWDIESQGHLAIARISYETCCHGASVGEYRRAQSKLFASGAQVQVYYVLIYFVIYCIHTFPDSKLYDFVTSKQTPGKFMHVEKMRGSV